MINEIYFEKLPGGLIWDYGFGKHGIGVYLWFWDSIILFIPENKIKLNGK